LPDSSTNLKRARVARDPAAQRRYRTFVAAGVNAPSPWAGLKAQTILGTDEFIAKLRRPRNAS